MTRTVSNLKLTLAAATLALLSFASTGAFAQNKAMVNVPFAFTANHQMIPAGHYQVVSSDSILMFVDANTGRTQAALLSRHEQGNSAESQGALRFLVNGTRYYLVEARFSGSSTHAVLLSRPKPERLAARSTTPTPSTIEVAMR